METQHNDVPPRRGRRIKYLLVGLVLGVVAGVASPDAIQWATDRFGIQGAETQIDLTTLEESMKQNNELSTAQYFYTNSVAITDQNTLELFGLASIAMPFTEATYIFEYDGVVKAGYDLSQATIERIEEDTVVVTLPPATILSHETGDVVAVYEQENIMNPLHAGEESAWLEGQKEEMEERAIELGLFNEAQANAAAVFTTLFGSTLPEGYTVELVFRDVNDTEETEDGNGVDDRQNEQASTDGGQG